MTHTHTQIKYDSEIPCVQNDFQFISGVAVWCPEAHTKATVLTMVDMDTGYVGVLMVSGKSPDNFMVRSTSSFVDKLRAEKTRLRYDNWRSRKSSSEHSSCHASIEDGHSRQNWGGHCAWTRTLPVNAETCSVGAQSIPASKPQERYSLGN